LTLGLGLSTVSAPSAPKQELKPDICVGKMKVNPTKEVLQNEIIRQHTAKGNSEIAIAHAAGKSKKTNKRTAYKVKSIKSTKKYTKRHVKVKKTLRMRFTHYTARCSGCSGKTRWGEHDVRRTVYYKGMRVVATDPKVIPPYSIIQFELDGRKVKAIALDTGSAIKGNRIDLLVRSEREASRRGVQMKNVKILRYGK
jgi:3D (Asp-Asp-Asp) domain-containing protein